MHKAISNLHTAELLQLYYVVIININIAHTGTLRVSYVKRYSGASHNSSVITPYPFKLQLTLLPLQHLTSQNFSRMLARGRVICQQFRASLD